MGRIVKDAPAPNRARAGVLKHAWTMASPNSPKSLWRLVDGKPGHMKQTSALASAIARRAGLTVVDIPAVAGIGAWWDALVGRFPAGASLPTPALVLGAGHATHASLVAARRATGAPVVVVMSPSVPAGWFDLVVAPRHDGAIDGPRVLTTRGALAPSPRPGTHDPRRGVILVGGPSRHFTFDGASIQRQIACLVERFSDIEWTLSTSRRTPADWLAGVVRAPNLTALSHESTPPGWLEETFADARYACVTPDSVSMVYEALTAGCRTVLFSAAPIPGSKIAEGIDELVSERRLIAGIPERDDPRLDSAPAPLDEAARCADVIIERFLR